MIAQIKGTVQKKLSSALIIETPWLSWRVEVPLPVWSKYQEQDQIKLWTTMDIREDSWSLIGFDDFQALNFFHLLTRVQGVGMKKALAVLSGGSLERIMQAIIQQELEFFDRIRGVSKKEASKIILELKDKIDQGQSLDLGQLLAGPKQREELIDALKNLGFGMKEIRPLLSKIDAGKPLEEQIKEALRLLR